jgi:arylsulfatase A-like enzyme
MNVVSQYKEADVWLGELLERAHYDYVLFVSDHGMDRNDLPGIFKGHHHAGLPESHIGIFALSGRGVRRGVELDTVDVRDFAPTVAHLLGLPVADDLPGRVLTEAFEGRWLRWNPIETVETWVGWEPEPEAPGRR